MGESAISSQVVWKYAKNRLPKLTTKDFRVEKEMVSFQTIWPNYSDVTRPGPPKGGFLEGKSPYCRKIQVGEKVYIYIFFIFFFLGTNISATNPHISR